jgi:hypothetical protein
MKKLLRMQLPHAPFASSLTGPDILLSTLSSNVLRTCSLDAADLLVWMGLSESELYSVDRQMIVDELERIWKVGVNVSVTIAADAIGVRTGYLRSASLGCYRCAVLLGFTDQVSHPGDSVFNIVLHGRQHNQFQIHKPISLYLHQIIVLCLLHV